MLSHRIRLPALALTIASVATLSACGGDDGPTGNSGDALTPGEAQFMVAAYFALLSEIRIPLLESDASPAGPAAVPYGDLYDDVIDAFEECSGGGSASMEGLITGDVDEEAGTADLSLTATADFVACIVPTEVVTFTLNGAPDLDVSADIDVTEELISITIGTEGAISYIASDGRSGTCAIDLTVAASASEAGVNETTTGSACGTSATQLQVTLFDD